MLNQPAVTCQSAHLSASWPSNFSCGCSRASSTCSTGSCWWDMHPDFVYSWSCVALSTNSLLGHIVSWIGQFLVVPPPPHSFSQPLSNPVQVESSGRGPLFSLPGFSVKFHIVRSPWWWGRPHLSQLRGRARLLHVQAQLNIRGSVQRMCCCFSLMTEARMDARELRSRR